jgi:adenosine deaminase
MAEQNVSPELQQFIQRETQVAQVQQMIATLTDCKSAMIWVQQNCCFTACTMLG